MTTKFKILAVVIVLLALVGVLAWGLPAENPGGEPGGGPQGIGGPELVSGGPSQTARELPGHVAGDGARTAIEPILDSAKSVDRAVGRLRISVAHSGDGGPAPGLEMFVRPRGTSGRFARRVRTDTRGIALFGKLAAGSWIVGDDRFSSPRSVVIVAGEETQLIWKLPKAGGVKGRVVDDRGQPIAGAAVEFAMVGLAGRDPVVLAITDREGRFEVRSLPSGVAIGARAHGFLAAPMRMVRTGVRAEAAMEFILKSGGGSLAGTVLDADGKPQLEALVCVGEQALVPWPGMSREAALPALAHCNQRGEFLAVGLAPGEHPVRVITPDHATWQGACTVPVNGIGRVIVELSRGTTIRGVVRGADGSVVAKADVELGDWKDLDFSRTRADVNGGFEFPGVGPGVLKIRAEHESHGEAEERLKVEGQEALAVVLTLSRGLILKGVVRDETGKPVAKVFVGAHAKRTADRAVWRGHSWSDAEGKFEVPNCPSGAVLRVEASGPIAQRVEILNVDANGGDLDLRVRKAPSPTIRITGSLVDAEGKAVAGAEWSAYTRNAAKHKNGTTGPNGEVEIGPLSAGEWTVLLQAVGFPLLRLKPRVLVDAERWDLGVLALARGGRVRVKGPGLTSMDCKVLRSGTKDGWVFRAANGVAQSPYLHVGDYKMMIWGERLAAQTREFSILPGQDVEMAVDGAAGVTQRIEFSVESGAERGPGGMLSIYRGATKLVDTWLNSRLRETWGIDVCLLPGNTAW